MAEVGLALVLCAGIGRNRVLCRWCRVLVCGDWVAIEIVLVLPDVEFKVVASLQLLFNQLLLSFEQLPLMFKWFVDGVDAVVRGGRCCGYGVDAAVVGRVGGGSFGHC